MWPYVSLYFTITMVVSTLPVPIKGLMFCGLYVKFYNASRILFVLLYSQCGFTFVLIKTLVTFSVSSRRERSYSLI